MSEKFMPPLEVSHLAVLELFGNSIEPFYRDDILVCGVECVPQGLCSGEAQPVRISFGFEIFPANDILVVTSVLESVPMEPWDGMNDLFASLESGLVPFFEGHYRRDGVLMSLKNNGTCYLGYEERILYTASDDDELLGQIKCAVTAAVRSLMLTSPLLQYRVYSKKELDAGERLQFLELSFGMWEVGNQSSDVPQDRIRFPPRLFGGMRAPVTQ